MTKEKNCKWYFGQQARGDEHGPNNPTAITFKGTKYHSLIRESIQNSLDAVLDETKPVTVSIDYRSFTGMEYPNFFILRDHINGCLQKYPHDVNAIKLFQPMLQYLNEFRTGQEIGYIRIVDTNTKGMPYDKNEASSPFNAFISEGISSNQNGSGGAFGFGKAVFWMYSPISTVFVSSKTDSQTNFVGKTKLCTHFLNPGEDLASSGLYSTNGDGDVITDINSIPDEFMPKERGTSVFILGASPLNDDVQVELTKAILRNYWMAIHGNKLIVKIDGETIDKEKLPTLMEQYFDNDNNGEKENHLYNPRPFYSIILEVEKKTGNDYKGEEKEIEIGGQLCKGKLYLHLGDETSGQFLFMRKPLMLVEIKKESQWKGGEGVFVCDDPDGNSFLREMENYAHDSWSRKNYIARENTQPTLASNTLKNISSFIAGIIAKERGENAQQTAQMAGSEELLTLKTPDGQGKGTPNEIIDPDSIEDKRPARTNPGKGTKTTIHASQTKKAVFDENGRLLSNRSGKKHDKPYKPGIIKPGTLKNHSKEDESGKEGIYATPFDVSYITWSQVIEDQVWHYIRIFSSAAIDNALIQIFAVDEDGRTKGIDIEEIDGDYDIRSGEEFTDVEDFDENEEKSTGKKKQVCNALSGMHINANIPFTIGVRFNSKIKYSLCINTAKLTVSDEN